MAGKVREKAKGDGPRVAVHKTGFTKQIMWQLPDKGCWQRGMCRNGTYPFSLEAFFHLQTWKTGRLDKGKWNPQNIFRSGKPITRNRVPRNRKHRTRFRKGSYGLEHNPMVSQNGKCVDSNSASCSALRIAQNGNLAFRICLHGR